MSAGGERRAPGFEELAGRMGYPPGRGLVVRELCRALGGADAEELRAAALAAVRQLRELAPVAERDRRARVQAFDLRNAAGELIRMAEVARAGVGRG